MNVNQGLQYEHLYDYVRRNTDTNRNYVLKCMRIVHVRVHLFVCVYC